MRTQEIKFIGGPRDGLSTELADHWHRVEARMPYDTSRVYFYAIEQDGCAYYTGYGEHAPDLDLTGLSDEVDDYLASVTPQPESPDDGVRAFE